MTRHNHVTADATFGNVGVEDLGAVRIVMTVEERRDSCVKHAEHDEMARRVSVIEVVLDFEPRVWTPEEHLGLVRIVGAAREIGLARQEPHTDVSMNVAESKQEISIKFSMFVGVGNEQLKIARGYRRHMLNTTTQKSAGYTFANPHTIELKTISSKVLL